MFLMPRWTFLTFFESCHIMNKSMSRLLATSGRQPFSGNFMKSRILVSVLFASALSVGAVMAATAPAELVKAYQAGVAGAKCDLNLDSQKSSKLGDAVQRIEQKSGLAQADLDALWASTQADADADKAAFCAKATPMIDAVLKAAK
jgi:hypothetical protein